MAGEEKTKHRLEGLVARIQKDEAKAHTAFSRDRVNQEKFVARQPDFAPGVSILRLIDAALGRKEEALREGRRAMELLSVEKDAINGSHMIENFVSIAAWVGEKDLACDALAKTAPLVGSGTMSYGELKLLPLRGPLRRYPPFENLLSSLAPK